MKQKRILLIIGGGIAAYKCLDLVRRAREQNIAVRAVMTRAAAEFITPLSVGALTNDRVFTDLFDLSDEREIGHIRLSREADLVIVAPATADLLAKMAGGHADDLASTVEASEEVRLAHLRRYLRLIKRLVVLVGKGAVGTAGEQHTAQEQRCTQE